MNILQEINQEYSLIEKQLDKVIKTISSIDANTNILEHDVMHLGGLIENLGLSLNELGDRHGTIN